MKKIKVHLEHHNRLVAGEFYNIAKLVNTASITVHPADTKRYHIGESLTMAQGEEVATDRRYEVTITEAPKQ
jgi:hypothetical protein